MNNITTIENTVIDYNVTDTAIAALKEKYSGLSISNKKERDVAQKAKSEVSGLRVSVEKRRVELKTGALEYGRKVDAEAKRVTALLQEVELPLKAICDEWDAEQERIKAEAARIEKERVDTIVGRINEYVKYPLNYVNKSSEEIRMALYDLSEADDFDYQEFVEEAAKAKESCRNSMSLLLEDRLQLEKTRAEEEERRIQAEAERKAMEEERARMEAERKALEEQQAATRREEEARQEAIRQEEQERARKEAEAERERIAKEVKARQELEIERASIEEEKAAVERKKQEVARKELELSQQDVKALEENIIPAPITTAMTDIVAEAFNITEPRPALGKVVKVKQEEMVTIRKAAYEKLKADSRLLKCLVAAGVKDWEGFAEADRNFLGGNNG